MEPSPAPRPDSARRYGIALAGMLLLLGAVGVAFGISGPLELLLPVYLHLGGFKENPALPVFMILHVVLTAALPLGGLCVPVYGRGLAFLRVASGLAVGIRMVDLVVAYRFGPSIGSPPISAAAWWALGIAAAQLAAVLLLGPRCRTADSP